MLDDLYFNLDCEVLAYRKLVQLASETQEAILSDKSEQILLIASQQAKLARKLQAHEEARMILIEKLFAREAVYEVNRAKPDAFPTRSPSEQGVLRAASFALPRRRGAFSPVQSEPLSLSQIISMVPEPYATKYATLRNELHSLISKLDVLCFQNARLIKSNIEYIDEMLFLLANLSRDSNSASTYTNTGKIDNYDFLAIKEKHS